MLHYFPEQVDVALAKKLKGTELTYADLRGLGRSDEATRKLIPGGYFGNPAGYDTGVASQYIEACSGYMADAIEGYIKGS